MDLPNLPDQSQLSWIVQYSKTENPVYKLAWKEGALFCLIAQVVSAYRIQLRQCHSSNLPELLLWSLNSSAIFKADSAYASSGGNEAFILYASYSSLISDTQKLFTDGPFQPALFLLPLGLYFCKHFPSACFKISK